MRLSPRSCGSWPVAASLLAVVGCQSGRVSDVLVNDDGEIISFVGGGGLGSPGVCVADRHGVRTVATGYGHRVLSRDGRFLLFVRGGFDAGSELLLHDIAAKRSYHTRLPRSFIVGRVGVLFGDGPSVIVCESEVFLRWDPTGGWQNIENPAGQLQIVPDSCSAEPLPPNIVTLAPDGWNARRTVWIRPNGATLELVRQNHAPLNIAILVGLAPLCLLGDGPLMLFGMVWNDLDRMFKPSDGDVTIERLHELQEQMRRTGFIPQAGSEREVWADEMIVE